MTKHAGIPQNRNNDTGVDVSVVIQRQVPQIQTVSKTVYRSASRSTYKQIVDVPVPHVALQEQIVEVAEIIPQERTSQHTVEPFVGVPVPQIQKQITEVAEIIPQERISEHNVEPFVGVPVLQIQEQSVEVEEIIPQMRISERIVDPTDDVPAPQILEEIVDVVKAGPAVKIVPQERTSAWSREKIVDAPRSTCRGRARFSVSGGNC